jgi:hypothetical protein
MTATQRFGYDESGFDKGGKPPPEWAWGRYFPSATFLQSAFIPLIFPPGKQKLAERIQMNPDQEMENRERPAEEKPAAAGPGQNSRRRGPRRPRFRRGPRDGGRDGRSEGREPVRPAEAPRSPKPPGTIREVIQQVEHIRVELNNVLEDIEEVIRSLDQVEREHAASEEEIDQLRESLRNLQRDPGQGRYARGPRPSAPREPAAITARQSESEPEARETTADNDSDSERESKDD